MHALLSTQNGGPETLELTEMPTPEPGPGQVRIAVKAAGVNFPDTLIIRDLYQFKPPRPFAPGGELSGIVEAVGDGVTHLNEGDRILALTIFGAYATHVLVDAKMVIRIPDAMPYEEAACFLMTYGTSHYALRDRADIQAGESLLILGAAGGVGSAAIELGKAMGARVLAGISSEEKAVFCKSLGADQTLVYPTGNLNSDAQKQLSSAIKAMAKSHNDAGGINVVLDTVGGDYAEPALRALAWEGRFLVVGFPAGIPAIPLNLTLLKSCQIMGVFWGVSLQNEPKKHRAYIAELFDWYLQGKIKPRITASYPLAEAGTALEQVSNRQLTGKAVITMS